MPKSDTEIIPLLIDIFARRGQESYLGEDVTMAEHMLQAAWFAEQGDANDALVVAALLHDVGHFMGEFGAYTPSDTQDRHHDEVGGNVLAPFFPAAVSDPVRLHVAAKRYLCAKEPAYFHQLSKASVHTLSLQGGPMTLDEMHDFEAEPHHQSAVQIRRWDDQGKVVGLKTRLFSDYLELLERMTLGYPGGIRE